MKKIIFFGFIFSITLQMENFAQIVAKDEETSVAQNQTLTLESSMKLAVENTTSVLKASNDFQLSGINLLKSYAQFLPNLTTQNSYIYSKGTNYLTSATPTTVKGSNVQATLSVTSALNLFNGFADYASWQASVLRQKSSEFTLNYVKQQIALDVAQSFLQVILDKKLEIIAEQNLRESQTREQLLTAQNRLGVKSLADLYLQQASTSTAELLLFTSKNKVLTDTLSLQQKLRLNLNGKLELQEPILPSEEKEFLYENENQLVENALAKRTDLQAVQSLWSSSSFDVQTANAGYLPKLDLVASAVSGGARLYSQSVNGVGVVPATQDNMTEQLSKQIHYSIGLNLTWNIFDRLVTYANKNQVSSQSYKLKLDLEDKHTQIVEEVHKVYGDYKLSLSMLQSSAKGLFAAEKAYQVMTGRYKVGSASFVDLMTAQDTLVQAESARALALINFQLQRWNMKYVLGDLLVGGSV